MTDFFVFFDERKKFHPTFFYRLRKMRKVRKTCREQIKPKEIEEERERESERERGLEWRRRLESMMNRKR